MTNSNRKREFKLEKARKQRDNRKAKEPANAASSEAGKPEPETAILPLAHPDANEVEEATSSILLTSIDIMKAYRRNPFSLLAPPYTNEAGEATLSIASAGFGANRPTPKIMAILQSARSDSKKLKAIMAVFRSDNREANEAEIALILLLPGEPVDKFYAMRNSISFASTAKSLEAEIAFTLLTSGNDVNRLAAAIRSYNYDANEAEIASILQLPLVDVAKLIEICVSVDDQKTWLCLKDGDYGTAIFSYNSLPAKSYTGLFKYNTVYSKRGPVANRLVIKNTRKDTSIRGWPHHEGREYGADGSGAQDGWGPLSIPAGGDTIWKSTASFQFLSPEGQSDSGAAGSDKIFVKWL